LEWEGDRGDEGIGGGGGDSAAAAAATTVSTAAASPPERRLTILQRLQMLSITAITPVIASLFNTFNPPPPSGQAHTASVLQIVENKLVHCAERSEAKRGAFLTKHESSE